MVSVAFIALSLPLGVHNALALRLAAETVQSTQTEQAFQQLLSSVFYCLSWLTYAINFYLYCLTGARFRDAFLSLLLFKCRQSDSAPIAVATLRPNGQPTMATNTATENVV